MISVSYIFVFSLFIFGMWLILSIFANFTNFKWIKWLKYRDPFSLIPSWSFFAPNPGTSDFQILYRDSLFDGTYTYWKEIEYRDKSLLDMIWNPEKRKRKAIVDLCTFVLQIADRNSKNKRLLVSVPYLTILTYINSIPRNNLAIHRQFLIARTFGFNTTKEPEILFISHSHRL